MPWLLFGKAIDAVLACGCRPVHHRHHHVLYLSDSALCSCMWLILPTCRPLPAHTCRADPHLPTAGQHPPTGPHTSEYSNTCGSCTLLLGSVPLPQSCRPAGQPAQVSQRLACFSIPCPPAACRRTSMLWQVCRINRCPGLQVCAVTVLRAPSPQPPYTGECDQAGRHPLLCMYAAVLWCYLWHLHCHARLGLPCVRHPCLHSCPDHPCRALHQELAVLLPE